MTPRKPNLRTASVTLAAGALSLAGTMASADQVINDDLIVQGSICAGFDCVNGESFGFDTLRLKENNLRIKAQDTSTSASFPTQDWQITFNDSTNGGANKFSIDAITPSSSTPFTIEAGPNTNALYVEDSGQIGFGTSNPVVELHIVDGDTPTLRLEQDGSSGFTPQTWDLAGNETNIFIRDVTGGSALPFRIRPGAATSSIDIEGTGDVGFGTSSPDANIHILETDGGPAEIWMETSSSTSELKLELLADDFNISFNGTGNSELQVQRDGDVRVVRGNLEVLAGSVIVQGSTVHPDYVFAPDYQLMPLHEVEAFITENRHLPKIPSATEVQANGLNLTDMQMALLEKVEELTLYTLQQQKTIDALQARLETLAD